MVLKIKNILNRSISYIQTDNGSEFSNTKFKTFCQDNSTAYKILDIHNNKIILSRTVDFFEDSPANSRISSPLSNNLTNFIPITDVRGSAPPYYEINQLSVNKRKREFASSSHANKRQKIIPKTYDPNSLIEPKTYKEIYTLQDSEEWLDAVQEELENMENLNVFTPLSLFHKGLT